MIIFTPRVSDWCNSFGIACVRVCLSRSHSRTDRHTGLNVGMLVKCKNMKLASVQRCASFNSCPEEATQEYACKAYNVGVYSKLMRFLFIRVVFNLERWTLDSIQEIRQETVYVTRFFLLVTLFVWRGCQLIKNRAERTGWHKQSKSTLYHHKEVSLLFVLRWVAAIRICWVMLAENSNTQKVATNLQSPEYFLYNFLHFVNTIDLKGNTKYRPDVYL